MNNRTENREQRVFLFIASFVILYIAFVTSLCYEMGKYGLGNIDWAFILRGNVPILIISAFLFVRAFNNKNN